MKRRSVLALGSGLAVCLAALAAWWTLDEYTRHVVHGAPPLPPFELAPPPADALRVLVVGDTGTGDWRQRRVALAMQREAAERGADLVLHTGDLFYRKGVSSVRDEQWREKVEEPFGGPLADVPIRPVLGNHDHLGDLTAYVAYAERSPRWRMPALYYAFSHEAESWRADFFALDTTLLVTDDEERARELAWLDERLAASDARWKIVVGHHSIHSGGPHGDDPLLVRELEPLLVRHGVDLYVSGHDHYLALLEPPGGVLKLVSGAGAKPKDSRWTEDTVFAHSDLGFAVLTVGPDWLEVRFHDDEDQVLFATRLVRDGERTVVGAPAGGS